MKRPSDISQEIWQSLPDELQASLSRNVNRSFINPEVEKNFHKIKSGQVLNHKVNSALNELRSLVIEAVKMDLGQGTLLAMTASQSDMIEKMVQVEEHIDHANASLKEFLIFINSRIEFYKGIL